MWYEEISAGLGSWALLTYMHAKKLSELKQTSGRDVTVNARRPSIRALSSQNDWPKTLDMKMALWIYSLM